MAEGGAIPKLNVRVVDDDDEEDEYLDSAFLKRLRATEKAKHTRYANKIRKHIHGQHDHHELAALRLVYEQAFHDCMRTNIRYIGAADVTTSQQEAAKVWAKTLAEDHLNVLGEIEAYIQEPEDDNESFMSSTSDKADPLVRSTPILSESRDKNTPEMLQQRKNEIKHALEQLQLAHTEQVSLLNEELNRVSNQQSPNRRSPLISFSPSTLANTSSASVSVGMHTIQPSVQITTMILNPISHSQASYSTAGMNGPRVTFCDTLRAGHATRSYFPTPVNPFISTGRPLGHSTHHLFSDHDSHSYYEANPTRATSLPATCTGFQPVASINGTTFSSTRSYLPAASSNCRFPGPMSTFLHPDPTYTRDPPQWSINASPQQTRTSISARLPRIDIKPFDGDPKNWDMFIKNFRILVHDELANDAQRLAMLRELLTPKVRNAVAELLYDPALYHTALAQLQEEFGHPFVVAQAHVDALLKLPVLQNNDSTSLRSFANELHGAVAALVSTGNAHELSSSGMLKQLLDKLPKSLRSKWGLKVYDMQPQSPTILDFDKWLKRLATSEVFSMAIPTASPFKQPSEQKWQSGSKKLSKMSHGPTINTVTKDVPDHSSSNYKCFACNISPPHSIDKCSTFVALNPTQRADLVKSERRCFKCVTGKHLSKNCPKNLKCSADNCGKRHHTLLHGAARSNPEETVKTINAIQKPAILTTNNFGSSTIALCKIVPVRIQNDSGCSLDVFGYIDGGSDATLLLEETAKALQLEGPKQNLKFGTFNGNDPLLPVKVISFTLSSTDGSNSFKVNGAYTVPSLNIPRRTVNWPAAKAKWPYLADFDFPTVDVSLIKVLIGMDLVAAHEQIAIRKPPELASGPVSIQTPLGWCLTGPVPRHLLSHGHNHRTCCFIHIHEHDTLHRLVEQFWSTETLATMPLGSPLLSVNEQQAISILERTVTCKNQGYTIGLPWKNVNPVLPNNRQQALKRFFALEARLRKDPVFAKRYTTVIEEYISLGHARLTTERELKESPPWTWYLPHHGVVNINKPDKPRVVFDGSAQFDGTSLNKNLLKGPDLLTSLVGVLIRFRQRRVPLSADIEKMYHQVQVKEDDQSALRFLWRPPGSGSVPLTYQMTVHVFGAISSPTTCIFALRKTAEDNRDKFSDVADLVVNNFYVDNYLDSVDTEDEAIKRASRLKILLSLGGFKLTKWLSSSRLVLSNMDPKDLASPSLNLDLDSLPVERTLGLLWDCGTDTFQFRINPGTTALNKRQILSRISSIFDPLGFLAPIVLIAKNLLQDIWQSGVWWDETLPPSILNLWKQWVSGLLALNTLKIPRCLQTIYVNPATRQLHVFSDASQRGFGAVAYLRTTLPDSTVGIAFVMAKSRVAPVKQLCIPRLELQGACISFRIASTIALELNLDLKKVVFWVDSETVLKWIHSTRCRFHAFVAHRVGEILTDTDRTQWRYVPGTLNPADDCSRGFDSIQLDSEHRWFKPPFLLEAPDHWPANVKIGEPSQDDPEVSKSNFILVSEQEEPNTFDEFMNRISNFNRLQRVVAWGLRFIHNCRFKRTGLVRRSGMLTIEETQLALVVCVKTAQQNTFPNELESLSTKRRVQTASRLIKLSPFIDGNGLIRVGGRLERAELPYSTKHPIVLAPHHPLATVIIWHFHRLAGGSLQHHSSHERVRADLRSQFWILRCRKTIAYVLNRCILCKRLRSRPSPPFMAPLPVHRLQPHLPPFTNSGVDYMGPLMVTVGRRSEKRWVCLFTCLTTRAVHLEVAHRLDTDSFLMCFQRFIDRRGFPTNVFSDNGTNFTAGEKELRQGIDQLDNTIISSYLNHRKIQWHFSPPSGPHFGGVWERLVGSCKSALRAILQSRSVSDEVLSTVMVDVEALLNSRPLTHVSVDPNEPEPLTPNHFLLGRAHPYIPLGEVDASESISRRHFRATQAILSMFWRRWLKEYVPSIAERPKWNQLTRNFQVGDIVLSIDPNSPRGQWPLARITEIRPGPDGIVRIVKIKTSTGEYTRPVTKLCLMSTDNVFSAEENRAGYVTRKETTPSDQEKV